MGHASAAYALCGSSSPLALAGKGVPDMEYRRGKHEGKFRGGGRFKFWREGDRWGRRWSEQWRLPVTVHKAIVCTHLRRGMPMGTTEQHQQSDQDERTIKNFYTYHERPRDPFIIFLFLMNLNTYCKNLVSK